MKKASKVPSTDSWPAAAVRPLDCGRRSPDDQLGRRPASAGRVDRACAAAGVSGVVARPRREVGEGLLSSTTTASLGRARRARWAAPLPQPSAPAPAHRSAPMLTAPTPPRAPQVDQATEPALASGPGTARCAPAPSMPYRAAVFGPAATPRGQRARRARGRGSPTAMGLARPRRQHLPEACLRSAPLVPLAEACAPPLARVGPGPRARARREPLFSVRTRRASPM